MPDQPVKHGHQHGPNGPDPVPFPAGGNLPRARVWATYAIPPVTVTGAFQAVRMNHGVTTDSSVLSIANIDLGGGVMTAVPVQEIAGVYGLTYRLKADAKGDATPWLDTKARVEIQHFTPDWLSPVNHEWPLGAEELTMSYLNTIPDDESFTGQSVRARVGVPTGSPSLTYGRSDYQSSWPIGNTGSYIEVVYLGAVASTQDWVDWWYETPADVALPTSAMAADLSAPERQPGRR